MMSPVKLCALWLLISYCSAAKDKCDSVSDEWRQVDQLDNSGSSQTNTLKVTTKTGITSTSTSGQTHGEGSTTTQELGGDAGVNLFEVFKAGMNAKTAEERSKNHDWTQTNAQAVTSERSVEKTFNVPGGKKLKVMQLIGKCDDVAFNTEELKPEEEGQGVSQDPPQKSHGGRRRRRSPVDSSTSIPECLHANNYCYEDKDCCSKRCQVPVVGQHGVCI